MSHICCNPTGLLLLGESSIFHIPKRLNVNFTFHCFIRARLLVLTAFRRDVVSIKPFTIEDLCNLATFHCLHSFKAFIRTIALLWNNPSISHRFVPQKDTTYRSNPNSLHLKGGAQIWGRCSSAGLWLGLSQSGMELWCKAWSWDKEGKRGWRGAYSGLFSSSLSSEKKLQCLYPLSRLVSDLPRASRGR